jgi:hypothetical protein
MSQQQTTSIASIGLVANLVISALEQHGIYEQMTAEQRNIYIPQFVEGAEERVGLVLFGDLTPAAQQTYVLLISNKTTTPAQIAEFWHIHHASFEERITQILHTYIEELLAAFYTTA